MPVTVGVDTASYAKKFPQFSTSELEKFHDEFRSFDSDNSGSIDAKELLAISKGLGLKVGYDDIMNQIKEVDKNFSGTIEFEEFLEVIQNLRAGGDSAFGQTYSKQSKLIKVKGTGTESTEHSINEDELYSFAAHMNMCLKDDKDVGERLPVDEESLELIYECMDGLLLAKLINDSVPDTIDERVLNKGKKINVHQKTENLNLVINSAKAIGCNVVNIGSQDILEGRPHLILGLIWQIIKIGLLSKIDLMNHPELYRLLEDGETLEDLLKLPADKLLLRWFNFHLKNAGHSRRVNNFSGDIKDGENYTILLNELGKYYNKDCDLKPLQESDLLSRAELVLQNADKLDCRKYITPRSLVSGNPKLNLAFVANLFNNCPALDPLSEEEMAALDEFLFQSEGDREARTFALWMNSLGVDPFVNNLFEDLRDGCILLQAFDKIQPGCVEWKNANPAPVKSKFKKVENTNYCVVLGKSLKFSLVGIQGSDIVDGTKNLTLGLVWQMMRHHVVSTIRSLSKDGKEVTDADMIAWANSKASQGGKNITISSFKDSNLKNGVFLLSVLNSMKKCVNWDLVYESNSEDELKMNAKYAISIARKLGAVIFCLPEDIVEVKPKMMLTFIGSLMAVDMQNN